MKLDSVFSVLKLTTENTEGTEENVQFDPVYSIWSSHKKNCDAGRTNTYAPFLTHPPLQ